MKTQTHRYHDICMGHRVVGHEGKCRHLHGHNYRIHFYCEADKNEAELTCDHTWSHNVINNSYVCSKCGTEIYNNGKESVTRPKLDSVGRVIDFGVMKEKLCQWLEDNWDHKFMHWSQDKLMIGLMMLSPGDEDSRTGRQMSDEDDTTFMQSLVCVDFNPTAENIAHYLLTVIAPQQLADTNVVCTKVIVEETAKCAVTAQMEE